MRATLSAALALVLLASSAVAQPASPEKLRAIMNEGLETAMVVVMDTSGSMRDRPQTGGDVSKIDIAKQALGAFLQGLPPDVQVGMMIFWGCQPRWMAELGKSSRDDVLKRVSEMQARGSTPIVSSLNAAYEALKVRREKNPYGRYIVLLITDGEETCSPPAQVGEAADRITKAGVELHSIGFDLPSADSQLKKMSTKYYLASDSKELEAGLQSVQGELAVDGGIDAIGK